MSDARRYAVWPDTRLRSCDTSSSKLEIWPFAKAISPAIYNGSWQLTSDFYTRALSKFDQAGFLIFGLVFVSRDFEVGMVRLLRSVDCQSHTGLIFDILYHLLYLCGGWR